MRISSRRRSIVFFTTLGSCLVATAVALNVGWILLTPRQIALLVLGIIFFGLLIAGLVLNTIFLVREIRRNEQHDSFINAVTHELKTPIASIRLYLETLQKREVDEARRQEFYRIMLEDNDRLLHTVEQVLRAGRANHKGRLDKAAIDLGEMARECLELAATRYHLDGRALSFKESFDADGRAIVSGDPEELRAAVSNLLDNAVKYSDSEVKIEVDVTTLDRGRAVVRVKDAGIGIPRGQLKRIFKRFHRVPMPVMKRIKGTGLGLFIVRSIVEKHGGRVFAESEGEGEGSTFTILLPRSGAR
ncbi:MAG: HAMP domain-containing sensor histidine kinase [Pyrinomonadaceae bacterium]